MRILVIGAGAIGSLFAGKLLKAGNEVALLARGVRLGQLHSDGLKLRSANSALIETCPVQVIASLETDDIFDYILVVVQRTQIQALLPILRTNKSPTIVFMVNTASGYAPFIDAVGAQRVMIAFPSAGGEVVDAVVHYRLGTGLVRVFQTTTIGELVPTQNDRIRVLKRVFFRAGIPTVTCTSMDAWQKTHVAIVCPIAQALYKHAGNPKSLAKHPDDVRLMIRAMQEGFIVLGALGYRIVPRKLWYLRLPAVLVAPIFSLILLTNLAETAMAKHARRATKEMAVLQQELLQLVDASTLAAPAIRALAAIPCEIQVQPTI
ncbi:ketopantoate reductase family protein [Sphaerochaeta globosa]|uniref:Ketopantoate reductase ApbA/PanE domain protein n=1 Tax=Sphaerochaeta globosa (strain ATCC BAA-1886 / DSM 22777 / Buddy) TaxID=158189 RepID=F0RU17_SPHGB|nr:2-dehydropantoate 2-reductase N-terminal domain-containing protein [Sphaerochaeta globosa]ADY13876.1 Ketopantoate reductase ApbA/PanE domain protein [Sphaerochaeta globosa str. Buddy]